MALFIVFSLAAAVMIGWWLWGRQRRLRRETLRAAAFPEGWQRMLQDRVPLYGAVPEPLRRQLNGHILVFLDEKHFEGCGGLEVTDEMRLVIAAQACMLLLNRETDYFSGFKTVLLYPASFVSPQTVYDGMVETVEHDVRVGESWHRGPVVLSWEDVERGGEGAEDGFNVVVHEFAHKLDEENDVSDGLPVLHDESQYRTWHAVFSREFERLRDGSAPIIDDYGATSPAEFFAVASETFFERPVALKDGHPQLYDELRKFYRVDPDQWHRHARFMRAAVRPDRLH